MEVVGLHFIVDWSQETLYIIYILFYIISHVTYFQLVSILNFLKDNFLALIKSATLAQKIAESQVLCRINICHDLLILYSIHYDELDGNGIKKDSKTMGNVFSPFSVDIHIVCFWKFSTFHNLTYLTLTLQDLQKLCYCFPANLTFHCLAIFYLSLH